MTDLSGSLASVITAEQPAGYGPVDLHDGDQRVILVVIKPSDLRRAAVTQGRRRRDLLAAGALDHRPGQRAAGRLVRRWPGMIRFPECFANVNRPVEEHGVDAGRTLS
jgi:hypothetical protein